jgi:YidC/Oxa1 family membrane protein insertase
MTNFLATYLGKLLYLIYSGVSAIGLDFGFLSAFSIAIILTTIIFKAAMAPLMGKQQKSMVETQMIQPHLQELQKKYKNDPQTLQLKTAELYKEHGVNPLGGCLPLLIQFPIIIAYFGVMRDPVKYVFSGDQALYDSLNHAFLWVKDLSVAENFVFADGVVNGISIGGISLPVIGAAIPVMALIAAFTTYLMSKTTASQQSSQSGGADMAQSMNRSMMIMMPLMIFWFALNYSVGLTIYWTISNIFSIFQYRYFYAKYRKPKAE